MTDREGPTYKQEKFYSLSSDESVTNISQLGYNETGTWALR